MTLMIANVFQVKKISIYQLCSTPRGLFDVNCRCVFCKCARLALLTSSGLV